MAIAVHVAGLVTVQVGTGAGDALESLGYTRNGADIVSEGFFLDVPGDENGGDEGPPIDVQYLGEITRIRVELTKYDAAVAAKVRCRVKGGTAGTPSAAGTLMFGDDGTMRVALDAANAGFDEDYGRCIVRMPVELNKGTKFSTLIFEFEAHKNAAGVLYDTTI